MSTRSTVELVRHARALPRSQWWNRDDTRRPLTAEGVEQAQLLARTLGKRPPERLVTSPYTRCRETLRPLAQDVDVDLEDAEAFGEALVLPAFLDSEDWLGSAWLGGRAAQGLCELAASASRLTVCSHGDVIPAALAVLAGRSGLAPPEVRLRKGWRMVLRLEGGRLAEASEPLAPDAPSPW